jgi:hypothetical protein
MSRYCGLKFKTVMMMMHSDLEEDGCCSCVVGIAKKDDKAEALGD